MSVERFSRFSEIQQILKVPKNQYNKFGDYYYRNTEDILVALKNILLDSESITLSDEIILIGERYYIKANANLRLNDSVFSAYGWARETFSRPKFDEAQLTGSASSYARKYALNGLLALDDSKDSDTTNSGDGDIESLRKEMIKLIKLDPEKAPTEKTIDWINKLNHKDLLSNVSSLKTKYKLK